MFILFIFITLFCLIQSIKFNSITINNTTINFYRKNFHHSGYLIKKYNRKIIINMKAIKKKFLMTVKFE